MSALETSANGNTGTMMPYTKRSVKIAVATVTMMKVFELRNLSKTGGSVSEPRSQTNMVLDRVETAVDRLQ